MQFEENLFPLLMDCRAALAVMGVISIPASI